MSRIEHLIGEDPTLLQEFREFLKKCGSEFDESKLIEKVDESDYSLTDWVEALVSFEHWMAEMGVQNRPFVAMLGYIHCCTMLNAPQVGLPQLKVIVHQSLIDYGFEEVSKNQI